MSVTIEGYTYDADVHCVECAFRYIRTVDEYDGRKVVQRGHSSTMGFWLLLAPIAEGDDPELVECPVLLDTEGNELHPIFSTDEGCEDGEYCECGYCISCHGDFIEALYRTRPV
jgi:hypothetical protein